MPVMVRSTKEWQHANILQHEKLDSTRAPAAPRTVIAKMLRRIALVILGLARSPVAARDRWILTPYNKGFTLKWREVFRHLSCRISQSAALDLSLS
jgi:hypothetical protein